MKYYELTPFVLHLTPDTIADSVLSLTAPLEDERPAEGKEPR
jgi:hypothetical protein